MRRTHVYHGLRSVAREGERGRERESESPLKRCVETERRHFESLVVVSILPVSVHAAAVLYQIYLQGKIVEDFLFLGERKKRKKERKKPSKQNSDQGKKPDFSDTFVRTTYCLVGLVIRN